jgi:nitrate reductase NapE component
MNLSSFSGSVGLWPLIFAAIVGSYALLVMAA